jgi:hypothetical protein
MSLLYRELLLTRELRIQLRVAMLSSLHRNVYVAILTWLTFSEKLCHCEMTMYMFHLL